MTPRHLRALARFFESQLGPGWEQDQHRRVTPEEALRALWTLNALYKPNLHLIQSLPYAASYEREADRALGKMSLGAEWTARDPKPIVWRVLLARHSQSLAVVQLNALQGSPGVFRVPEALPRESLPLAAALSLQYELKPDDRQSLHGLRQLSLDLPPQSFERH